MAASPLGDARWEAEAVAAATAALRDPSAGVRRIGLLGTRVVMRTRFYGQLQRTQGIALDDDIDRIGQAYTDMAVAGRCTPEQRALFLDAGRQLVQDHNADAVVLAGTDLNLAFDGQDPGYRVIDALDVHVDVLARLAVGQTDLKDVAE